MLMNIHTAPLSIAISSGLFALSDKGDYSTDTFTWTEKVQVFESEHEPMMDIPLYTTFSRAKDTVVHESTRSVYDLQEADEEGYVEDFYVKIKPRRSYTVHVKAVKRGKYRPKVYFD